MTLLRGLGVEELTKPELTGEWEYKLAQMEHGKLGARGLHARDRRDDASTSSRRRRSTTATRCPATTRRSQTPCPNCGGVVKENYRRYHLHRPRAAPATDACGFSFGKTPAGRTFELAEVEQFLRDKRIGPLDGFRSKAGWPFTAEIVLKYSDDDEELEARVRLRRRRRRSRDRRARRLLRPGAARPLPEVRRPRVRAAAATTSASTRCRTDGAARRRPATSRAGKIILQQPVEREQMAKLLATGKTDLLDKFVSMRTRRPFKAFLAWDTEAGKVNFEFDAVEVPAAQGPAHGTGRPREARAAAARKAARRPPRRRGGEEGATRRRRPRRRRPRKHRASR